MNNETLQFSQDAILEDKCRDTSGRLHDISGEGTLASPAHDEKDARKKQMLDADRKNTVTKQVTGNEFLPRHMWVFPPLLLRGAGNPYGQLFIPTSKFQASISPQDNYVTPVLTKEERQKRENVFRFSPDRRISENNELREVPATSPNKHGFSRHPNASFTNYVFPSAERPTVPDLLFAKKGKKGERCGIHPLNLHFSENNFELMKRKTMEGEREQVLVDPKQSFHVVNKSHLSNAKKRRLSETETLKSQSSKRFCHSVGKWDHEEQKTSVVKDNVFVLENSQISRTSEAMRKAGKVSTSPDHLHDSVRHPDDNEEQSPSITKKGNVLVLENSPSLDTLKRTSESSEHVRSPADDDNKQSRYILWDREIPQKSDESKTDQGEATKKELFTKHGWKQNDSSPAGNEAKPDQLKNNYYHKYYHRDWFVPVPPYLNSIRATESNGLFSYGDRSVRAKSKAELSSVWFPFQLTPKAEQPKVVTKDANRNHIWNPEFKSASSHLSNSERKRIFFTNQESINSIDTRWNLKNSKLTDETSLSPIRGKEFSSEETRVDMSRAAEERIRGLSRKLEELCATADEHDSMSSLPDHSTVNTAESPSNTKKDETVQSFEYHDLRIPSNYSPPGSVQIRCRSDGPLISPREQQTSLKLSFEAKQKEGKSLSIVDLSESSSDFKKENAFKAFDFRSAPVGKTVSSSVKKDSDRLVSPVRSPEQNWTNVAVIDNNERLESSRLQQDEKKCAVKNPGGKVFSDHSTVWLLNKETKTPYVHSKLSAVTRSSPPRFWTLSDDLAVASHLRSMADKSQVSSSKTKETFNSTHHHRCEVCNSTFPLRRLLNRHLKTHSFYKRYSCSYCEKGFNDTFDLKRHVRTHTGIKPFKCDRCDKSFTQRCSLEAHQSRVHGIVHKFGFRERRAKMFVCEQCGATFKDNQSEYMNHMANEHPDNDKSSWDKKSNRLSQIMTF